MSTTNTVPCLFVEARLMRPTALRVLQAISELGVVPCIVQDGCTIDEIVQVSGLSRHVVQARLQDLRRKGFVESDLCPDIAATSVDKRYAHYLTVAGVRRLKIE